MILYNTALALAVLKRSRFFPIITVLFLLIVLPLIGVYFFQTRPAASQETKQALIITTTKTPTTVSFREATK